MRLFIPTKNRQLRLRSPLELPRNLNHSDIIPDILPIGSVIRLRLEFDHEPNVRVYFDEIPGLKLPKEGNTCNPSWSIIQRLVPLEVIQGLEYDMVA